MNAGASPAAVVCAQASLDAASSALDTAVRSLAENDGETVMADAGLAALLMRVIEAKRNLAEIADPKRSLPPASLR